MKQIDWVKIMLDSVTDQMIRASKTSKRMATFFERKGDIESANVLKKIATRLEHEQDELWKMKKTLA